MPELLQEHCRASPRSGGPRTKEGKANSSRNALTHGSCSKQLIVKGERQEDYDELHEHWFSSYDAEQAGRSLLEEAVLNEWLLKRSQRNYLAVDARLQESDPNDWTEEQLHRLGLMQRYKTGAERSFHRSVAAVERFRRTRVYEAIAMARADERVADRERRECEEAEEDEPELTVREKLEAVPKLEKVPEITQYVTVRVVDEKTVTTLSPSNEELLEQSKAMEPPPERVFRMLHISPWAPEEYWWAQDLPGQSKSREQVMKFDEWLQAMEREKETEGGHVGPAELDPAWVSWYREAVGDWEEEEEDSEESEEESDSGSSNADESEA